MCDPNCCNVTKIFSRDQRTGSCHASSYLIHLLAMATCPREPLVFFIISPPPHTHTHTHTFFPLSLSLSLFCPFPSSLTPIALARNTAPCFSWQNSAGCPCVPEKPAFSPSSPQPTRTFLTFSCLLSANSSLQPPHIIQAPRQKAGQGGTDTSSRLHYIHILPVSLPPSPKSLYNSPSLRPNPPLWWLLALFALSV